MYLFDKICPTPLVPFSLIELNAAGGVMVTASHNPKDDNGYKVYWENGPQVSLLNFNTLIKIKGTVLILVFILLFRYFKIIITSHFSIIL